MQFQYQKFQVMRPVRLLLLALLLVPLALQAQDNPAPLPPNYELIKKETGRWFGEYRYKSLVTRFKQCDTTMTVDHFRCLYYGAALRGDSTQTLMHYGRSYRQLTDSLGQWHPTTQREWWRLQMLTAAVWSSGNGERDYPFYVSCKDDAHYMMYECRDMPYDIYNNIYPYEYFPPTLKVVLERAGLLPDERQAALFRQLDKAYGHEEDSLTALLLSTYEEPEKRLWADLQLAIHNRWNADDFRAAIGRHRGVASPLMADLYHLAAEEYYFLATKRACDSCFAVAVGFCDSALLLWPGSDGAERCRVLRKHIMQPEVQMQNDHQQHIGPLPASEWALTTLWHRNAKRVWLQLYDFSDTTFQHPLREWDMRVTRHDDLFWHEAYVYLPPMAEGRYLLRASADKHFSEWSEIEIVRSDLTLLYNDQGQGFVLNIVDGSPVEGFRVEAFSDRDSFFVSTVTDRFGMFNLGDVRGHDCPRLHAMHGDLDLGRGMYLGTWFSDDEEELRIDVTIDGQRVVRCRPGDTVHFDCRVYSLRRLVADTAVSIYLLDQITYEFVDSVTIVTDSQGRGHGTLVLPMDSSWYTIGSEDMASIYTMEDPSDDETWDYRWDEVQANPSMVTPKPIWRYQILESGSSSWDTLQFEYEVYHPQWADSTDVGIRLERVRVPQEHKLNPTAMSREAEHSIGEKEYRRRYPLMAYDWRLNNSDSWPSEGEVFCHRRRYPSDVKNHGVALPPLSEGVYRTCLTLYGPSGRVIDTTSLILYPGRMPFVADLINAWCDTAVLQVGDTLWVHIETWLPDQQAVLSVSFNKGEFQGYSVKIPAEGTVDFPIPVLEEGFMTIYLASSSHGVPFVGTAVRFVGELGGVLFAHAGDFLGMGEVINAPNWRRYRCRIHRPAIVYPERKQILYDVWGYLGISPNENFIELYCPGEYHPGRLFGYWKQLPR